MKYNFNNGYTEYSLLNPESKITDREKSCIDLFKKMEKIYSRYNIPKLSKYGYNENNIYDFSKEASKSLTGSFDGNPVIFNEEAVRTVIRNLI